MRDYGKIINENIKVTNLKEDNQYLNEFKNELEKYNIKLGDVSATTLAKVVASIFELAESI